MTQINPKTQAVIDAFLDYGTPAGLRPHRKAMLKDTRPLLYAALERLVRAVGPQIPEGYDAEKEFNEM